MSHDPYDDPEFPPALGAVVEQGRGSLPFALIHGEALVACASWALGDSGVTLVDLGTEWAGLIDADEPFVLHDALCPMTPATFIASCVRTCLDEDVVVAGTAPDGSVRSPVVLPAAVVAALAGPASLDFEELVASLQEEFEVRLVEAPASATRVRETADLPALEALTTPERR